MSGKMVEQKVGRGDHELFLYIYANGNTPASFVIPSAGIGAVRLEDTIRRAMNSIQASER